jgi:hypothetical protein
MILGRTRCLDTRWLRINHSCMCRKLALYCRKEYSDGRPLLRFLIGGKTDYQALPLASMAHNAGLVAYESIDMPVPTYGKKLWVYDRSKCLWNSHHLPKLHEGWYQADWAIRGKLIHHSICF